MSVIHSATSHDMSGWNGASDCSLEHRRWVYLTSSCLLKNALQLTQPEHTFWPVLGLILSMVLKFTFILKIINLLYVFFWVFPRRPTVVCRRFETLYQFHLQGLNVKYEVLYILYILYIQPLKMELTEGSETSANHNRTPGKYPKEYIQDSKQGESLKSRITNLVTNTSAYRIREIYY